MANTGEWEIGLVESESGFKVIFYVFESNTLGDYAYAY